ncbi:NADPH oxidase organizer 1, partial [Manis javanica]|uniref:NADPH oxidase organizer 1 n=1 Tax=Manis javanica TaxID=9974 RepID=UPI003C6DADA0
RLQNPRTATCEPAAVATPRHPVSLRASALVQTARFQVRLTGPLPAPGGGNSSRPLRNAPALPPTDVRLLCALVRQQRHLRAQELGRIQGAPYALLPLRRGRVGRGLEHLRLLEDYLRALVARVSRSPALTDFLEPHALDLEPALSPGSLVILPAPEEPPAHPAGSPSIRGLEPQSLCCLQPFHTQHTRGRLFHAQAQEALEVLLRHPSGWWLVENEGSIPEGGRPGPRGMAPTRQWVPVLCFPGLREQQRGRAFGASGGTCRRAGNLRPWVVAVQVREGGALGGPARTGLLPALLLRPDWLGAVLGVSGPHLRADGSAGEAGRSLESTQATTLTPAVPARPMLSVIQSRCCTITRRALGQDPEGQGPP